MGEKEEDARDVFQGKPVSRRDFLKIAGIGGATIGLGAGLGGLVAACGGTTTTTTAATTAPTTATTAAGPTTTAGASTTTVTRGSDAGRDLKIGLVSPKTGSLATFAIADDWWVAHAKAALANGFITGDGKQRQVQILVSDTQSDSNRAAQVTGDLITNSNVDMVLSSGSPDTVNPCAQQAETLGVPSLHSFSPWQALFLDTSGKPVTFQWVYGNLLGSEQTISSFIDAFNRSGIQTNKKVGMLFANDADEQGWMAANAAPAIFKANGYTLTFPTPYTEGAEDFTKQISEYKAAGCEILCGTNNPPDYSNFTKQAIQQGFLPKVMSSGKALIFPQAVDTYPNNGLGMLGEFVWGPSWKIKDTLSDLDSSGLADDYEAKTGQQWTSAISTYGKFEWAIDVYKRATNAEDKNAVVAAIKTTNGMFQTGKIDFTEPVDANGFHVNANNYKPYIGAQQWIKGTGKYPVEAVEVSNATAPGTTVEAQMVPMTYAIIGLGSCAGSVSAAASRARGGGPYAPTEMYSGAEKVKIRCPLG